MPSSRFLKLWWKHLKMKFKCYLKVLVAYVVRFMHFVMFNMTYVWLTLQQSTWIGEVLIRLHDCHVYITWSQNIQTSQDLQYLEMSMQSTLTKIWAQHIKSNYCVWCLFAYAYEGSYAANIKQSSIPSLFIDSNSTFKETGNEKQSDILQSKPIRVLVSEKCQRAQRLTNTVTKFIQISLRDEPAIN